MLLYLAKVIKPAGMNFQEFRNLHPMTTAREPEVPEGPEIIVAMP